MKKYIPQAKKEDHVKSTRYIDPSEWDEFDRRMEKIMAETRSKEIASYKSGMEVRVK
jgi:hypothetical protein